jgi:hypothetical protein
VSSSLNWVVVWNDPEDGREYRDHSRSRALALNAACDLIRQQHTVQRIEGRNGVIIGRQAIEQYCAKIARGRRIARRHAAQQKGAAGHPTAPD